MPSEAAAEGVVADVGHLSCHIRSLFPLIKAYTPRCLCDSCHLAQDNGVMNNHHWFILPFGSSFALSLSLNLYSHYVSRQTLTNFPPPFPFRAKRAGNDGASERASGRKRLRES